MCVYFYVYFIFSSRATISIALCCHVVLPYCPIHCFCYAAFFGRIKWWCVTVLVGGRLNVNVALNRPAYQSSTYYDIILFISQYASHANDGSHVTDLAQSSCMHTNLDLNPWWAVDLGLPLHVTGVKFTNVASLFCTYTKNNNKIYCRR